MDQAKTSRKDPVMELAENEDNEGECDYATDVVPSEPIDPGLESKEMWDFFVSALDRYTRTIAVQHRRRFSSLIARLKTHQPGFIKSTDEEAASLRAPF